MPPSIDSFSLYLAFTSHLQAVIVFKVSSHSDSHVKMCAIDTQDGHTTTAHDNIISEMKELSFVSMNDFKRFGRRGKKTHNNVKSHQMHHSRVASCHES